MDLSMKIYASIVYATFVSTEKNNFSNILYAAQNEKILGL
jgi:hypothetical protein